MIQSPKEYAKELVDKYNPISRFKTNTPVGRI